MKRNVTWIKSGVKGENILLNGYDYLVSHTYLFVGLIYKNKLDVDKIQTALKEILPSFPVLCGRIIKNKDGYLVIDQNDKGFRFEVRQSDEKYQMYDTENNFSKKLRKFSFSTFRVVNKNAPLGAITITHFKDKGSVLTFSFPHSVSDSTFVYFLIAISQQLHNQQIPPYTFNRKEFKIEGMDFGNEKEYVSLVPLTFSSKVKVYTKIAIGLLRNKTKYLKIEGATLKKMSKTGAQMSDELRISKEDILAAILWKCIAKLKKKKPLPILSYTINLRFKSSVDNLFIGNASTGLLYDNNEELMDKPILEIAKVVRKGLVDFNDEYIARESYFLSKYVEEKKIGDVIWKELIEAANGRAFMFDPGHKFPFFAMDFGSGSPDWYELPTIPLRGFVFTIINPDMESIDLKVCLRKNEIRPFVESTCWWSDELDPSPVIGFKRVSYVDNADLDEMANYHAEAIIDVWAFLSKDTYAFGEHIKVFHESDKLYHSLVRTMFDLPLGMAGREYLHHLYKKKVDDRTWIIAYRTPDKEEEKTLPSKHKGFVRCQIYNSGDRFHLCEDGRIRVEHLMTYTLEGGITPWMADNLFKKAHINAYFKEGKSVKEIFDNTAPEYHGSYPSQFSMYVNLERLSAEKLLLGTTQVLDDNRAKWISIFKNNDINVWKGFVPYCPLIAFKSELILNVDVNNLADFLANDLSKNLSKWNSDCVVCEIVKHIDDTEKRKSWLYRSVHSTKFPYSNREYTYFLMKEQMNDGSIVIAYQSVLCYNIPVPKNTVRGNIYPSVYRLTSISDQQTKLEHIKIIELNGKVSRKKQNSNSFNKLIAKSVKNDVSALKRHFS